jgi:hypothetical protein
VDDAIYVYAIDYFTDRQGQPCSFGIPLHDSVNSSDKVKKIADRIRKALPQLSMEIVDKYGSQVVLLNQQENLHPNQEGAGVNYFEELEKLNKAIGFGPERTDVLVYAENGAMFSIQKRSDLDMQKANSLAGFAPLALITWFEVITPEEGTKKVSILHTPLDYSDTDGLRKRMSCAVFSLGSGTDECTHVDYHSQVFWTVGRKEWLAAVGSSQTQ